MNLQKKADRLLQEKYAIGKCEMCPKPVSCVHHLFPKSSSSALRFYPPNLVRVCVGCHLKFHSKFSSEMIDRVVLKRGQKWFDDLQKKRHEIIKTNKKYYEEIIKELITALAKNKSLLKK